MPSQITHIEQNYSPEPLYIIPYTKAQLDELFYFDSDGDCWKIEKDRDMYENQKIEGSYGADSDVVAGYSTTCFDLENTVLLTKYKLISKDMREEEYTVLEVDEDGYTFKLSIPFWAVKEIVTEKSHPEYFV